jgi:prepilin-type N-terminal cleavage/methylation domain-containing protein
VTAVRRKNSERGVTLVELLIAITLVAAISTGLLMAIRISLTTLDKVQSRLESNRRAMEVQQLIVRQIGSVIPTVSPCGPPGRAVFAGTASNMRLATSYSMLEGARGYPRLVDYAVQPDPKGGVRLVMMEQVFAPVFQESVCAGALPPGQPPPVPVVLAEKLATCRFVYHEYIPDALDQGNWVLLWDRPNLPSAVRIEMAPLVPNPAELPMATLHIPIHINRIVVGQYVDEQ